MFSEELYKKIDDAFNERFKKIDELYDVKSVMAMSKDDDFVACLKFFYAFMPLSDIANYKIDLFEKIATQALKLREKNIFNQDIPEDIFLNYVLQCRINNENLEYNRDYFYDEIMPRVADKTVIEAVIEANYWCLEKVTYTGNDPRTMSPFTLIKNTKGRCGEESVFTVSALRSIGIPARQVYTPLWAHSESNHAWVEVYIDNKWQFLGACEPEPVLNRGWFGEPCSKGMLMYTRLFSTLPPKSDEVAYIRDNFCEVNLTQNYVQDIVKLNITLQNYNKDTNVYIQIVNSCVLSSIIMLQPNNEGIIQTTIGKGDVYLHIEDGKRFITKHVDTKSQTDVAIDFSTAVACEHGLQNLTMKPPMSNYKEPDYGITKEQQKAHEERITQCNAIREAYAATFVAEAEAKRLSNLFGIDKFSVHEHFIKAKGNIQEIISFYDKKIYADKNLVEAKYKVLLLNNISDKDFTDCTADILEDHLKYAYKFKDNFYEDIFAKYVLSPKIDFEIIRAWREHIYETFDCKDKADFEKTPQGIWQWLGLYIKNEAEYKTGNDSRYLVATPLEFLNFLYGGQQSKKILFVAICRTLGMPARLNIQNGEPQYYENNKFIDICSKNTHAKKYTLTIEEADDTELKYFENISVARLVDGKYITQFFDYHSKIDNFELEEGHYRIILGRRLESLAMKVSLYHVHLTQDLITEVQIPKEETQVLVQKSIDNFEFESTNLEAMLTGRDFVAYIEPSKEPTEHLLRELIEVREEYRAKNIQLILVTQSENDSLKNLRYSYGMDVRIVNVDDNLFAKHIIANLELKGENLPVCAFITNDSAAYYSQGYQVGVARRVLGYCR